MGLSWFDYGLMESYYVHRKPAICKLCNYLVQLVVFKGFMGFVKRDSRRLRIKLGYHDKGNREYWASPILDS